MFDWPIACLTILTSLLFCIILCLEFYYVDNLFFEITFIVISGYKM